MSLVILLFSFCSPYNHFHKVFRPQKDPCIFPFILLFAGTTPTKCGIVVTRLVKWEVWEITGLKYYLFEKLVLIWSRHSHILWKFKSVYSVITDFKTRLGTSLLTSSRGLISPFLNEKMCPQSPKWGTVNYREISVLMAKPFGGDKKFESNNI